MNRLALFLVLACTGALLCASCVSEEETASTAGTPPSGTTGKPTVPPMPQNDDPKVLVHLQEFETKQAEAKAALDKDPKDAKAKAGLVKATNTLASEVMDAVGTLGPRQAYPRALRLYREVLTVDPGNEEAKEWIAKIEEIYKSMGRPIPEG